MANGFLIAALLLLLVGSEAALRGGVGIARYFDIPPLWTGVLVVATATTLPELFVSLRAASMGAPQLALGGLIGTNIINLLFVMGLGALIHPMASPPKVVFRDGGAMLLGSLALIAFAVGGTVSRQGGALLLAGFAAYVVLIFITDRRRAPEHSVPLARALYRSNGEIPSLIGAAFLFFVGLILLALGAHLGVLGARAFARQWGWEDATIGLTIVAAGLSFPKLLVTLGAAARRQTSIAVGLLLGAGVFNLFGVLGITALVTPLAFSGHLAKTDVFVLAAVSAALLPLLAMRWVLSRPRGMLLMLAYGCYVAFLLWRLGLPLPKFF
jgi:cation:H+ antiporter